MINKSFVKGIAKLLTLCIISGEMFAFSNYVFAAVSWSLGSVPRSVRMELYNFYETGLQYAEAYKFDDGGVSNIAAVFNDISDYGNLDENDNFYFMVSSDGGKNWSTLGSMMAKDFAAGYFKDDKYPEFIPGNDSIIVKFGNIAAFSKDCLNWVEIDSNDVPWTDFDKAVIYNSNGMFFIIGYDTGGNINFVSSSSDGENWTRIDDKLPNETNITRAVYMNGKYLVNGTFTWVSEDGLNWVNVDNKIPPNSDIRTFSVLQNSYVIFVEEKPREVVVYSKTADGIGTLDEIAETPEDDTGTIDEVAETPEDDIGALNESAADTPMFPPNVTSGSMPEHGTGALYEEGTGTLYEVTDIANADAGSWTAMKGVPDGISDLWHEENGDIVVSTDSGWWYSTDGITWVAQSRYQPVIHPVKFEKMESYNFIYETIVSLANNDTIYRHITSTEGSGNTTFRWADEAVIETPRYLWGVKNINFQHTINVDDVDLATRNSYTYEVVNGTLPQGLSIGNTNGEEGVIFGIPTQTNSSKPAEFTVQVKDSGGTPLLYRTYTMEVVEETGVYGIVDEGLRIAEFVGDAIVDDCWELEVVDGNYKNVDFLIGHEDGSVTFSEFYFNGTRLRGPDEQNPEYIVKKGSTRITISSQTVKNHNKGKNTIAAEFRVNNNTNDTKIAAQTFTVKQKTTTAPPPSRPSTPSGGGGGQNSGSGGAASAPTTEKPAAKPVEFPEPQPVVRLRTHNLPFTDVYDDDWFINDVEWAYQNRYMLGVSDTTFKPNSNTTLDQISMTLASLADVDLSEYKNARFYGVDSNDWFVSSAMWAASNRLFEGVPFVPNKSATRGELAVMLVKYLDRSGVEYDTAITDNTFIDAHEMSSLEWRSFQILRNLGIFLGKSNMDMDAKDVTSRAEHAALLKRLSSLIK